MVGISGAPRLLTMATRAPTSTSVGTRALSRKVAGPAPGPEVPDPFPWASAVAIAWSFPLPNTWPLRGTRLKSSVDVIDR